jgi:excreted virulence factor EspC (type VII ESX diderm)
MAPPLKVDPRRLKQIADDTAVLADGVGTVERSFADCPPLGDAVFGDLGLGPSYRQFHDLWAAEVHTATGGAHELADGLARSAVAYAQTDAAAANGFAGGGVR